MFRLLTISIIFAAQAAPACPQTNDPDKGIRLTRDAPFFSVLLKPAETGLAEQRVMVRGASPEHISSVYPHPLIVSERRSANGTLQLEYANAPDGLDQLFQTKIWQSDVVLLSNGVQAGVGSTKVKLLDMKTVSIGGCTYDVWRVLNTLALDNRDAILTEKHFSPALGVVLKTVRLSPDGQPVSAVEFDTIE